MPEFKNHILVCDVEREDGIHCGNKGGAEVKQKVVEIISSKVASDLNHRKNLLYTLLYQLKHKYKYQFRMDK